MSVLARAIEAEGLTTVTIALLREHAEKVNPPRALFVPFPYGYPLGKAEDAPFQHRVISAALALLDAPKGPVLEEFPDEAGPNEYPQASGIKGSHLAIMEDAANEITALRPFYERWVEAHGGRTAVGVCGIPQRRFRGMIRFLQTYARGEEADIDARPAGLTVPQYIRHCVDDLKAFYYEARMAQKPTTTEPEIHTWFWGETAGGKLTSQLAQVMTEADDPAIQRVANGLAR
ncbi:MAG: hypothetical protein IIC99_04710 [Chloroflexi bacterium]|nr:hypothetical protein [Chloroflexota bacterium]